MRTPSLTDAARQDAELKHLVKRYWDTGLIRKPSHFKPALATIQPDCELPEQMEYVHHRLAESDFYFISNQEQFERLENVIFRVSGKLPELWDPETGETIPAPNWNTTRDGRTQVQLQLDPAKSLFVVFREPTQLQMRKGPHWEYQEIDHLNGRWRVQFDPKFGPVETQVFDKLTAWNHHPNEQIKYFSGTATYQKSYTLSELAEAPLYLDLGQVDVMARVFVNGKDLGVLWKPPYRINISDAIVKGENKLEIRVTNLWVNRLIGDASLPETGKIHGGGVWRRFAYEEFPEWILSGQPAPKGHRQTFATWSHYHSGGELVPSGLIGPVRFMQRVEKGIGK